MFITHNTSDVFKKEARVELANRFFSGWGHARVNTEDLITNTVRISFVRAEPCVHPKLASTMASTMRTGRWMSAFLFSFRLSWHSTCPLVRVRGRVTREKRHFFVSGPFRVVTNQSTLGGNTLIARCSSRSNRPFVQWSWIAFPWISIARRWQCVGPEIAKSPRNTHRLRL